MEQIIRYFGRGLKAAAVAFLLIAMLFEGSRKEDETKGILKMTGAAIKPGSICYTTYEDYKELQREAEKPEPFFIEKFHGSVVYAGEGYCLSDYVEALDETGKRYSFLLEKVSDKTGRELGTEGWEQNGIWHFEQSGVYTLYLMAKNDAGKKIRYQITVPVARSQERNKSL